MHPQVSSCTAPLHSRRFLVSFAHANQSHVSIARKPLCSIAFPSMHHQFDACMVADATHSQVVFLRITPQSSHPIRHTVLYEINTLVYVFPVTIVTMLLQCCNNAVTRACACDFRGQASVASDTYVTTHVHIRPLYTYVYATAAVYYAL
jgi:hypothetical protein